MKKVSYLLIGIFASILFVASPKAYVRLGYSYPTGYLYPVSDSRIINPNNSWGAGSQINISGSDYPFFNDIGQYFTFTNVSGNYLSIDADYYLGIAFQSDADVSIGKYSGDRNPLRASQLRCGIGSSYGTGYSSMYSPEITNFSVEITEGLNPNQTFYHLVYHIKFHYNQQIGTLNSYSGNASCWFENSSDIGLFLQLIPTAGSEFYYYNKTFNAQVLKDSNSVLFEEMITQNEETNQKLDDLNDSLNDDNVDAQDSQINDLLNDDAFKDKTGLSSVISAPINILNNLTNSCQPINLTIPYMNVDVSIPCMSTSVYNKFPSGFINTISAIINGFLVYRVVLSLYGMIHKFKDPEDDRIEVVDL